MNTYHISALWEDFKFVHLEVKAKDEKTAKAKARKRVRGKITGLRVERVTP